MTFGCALRAPHGGIFVFPVVDHALLYCAALAAGSVVGAVILSLLKKNRTDAAWVNRKAMEGTILAHTDGGVPEVLIEVDDLTAYNVGYLIYFFWRACACSGYLLSVNPFNQPGVESYKKNMFALLGKPGYENLTAELEAKLK